MQRSLSRSRYNHWYSQSDSAARASSLFVASSNAVHFIFFLAASKISSVSRSNTFTATTAARAMAPSVKANCMAEAGQMCRLCSAPNQLQATSSHTVVNVKVRESTVHRQLSRRAKKVHAKRVRERQREQHVLAQRKSTPRKRLMLEKSKIQR